MAPFDSMGFAAETEGLHKQPRPQHVADAQSFSSQAEEPLSGPGSEFNLCSSGSRVDRIRCFSTLDRFSL